MSAAPGGTLDAPGALAGLRVLDLTRVLAGPLCTMTLGDMGAEVVKVEQPGRGDDTRAWGPPFQGAESAYFLSVNRNKQSLTLNLKEPRGREILAGLIRSSDVVIDNFKLGTMEGWGFDADFFSREAPRTIRCSITGYGSTGPKAALPGYDFLLQAESGLMAITGEADGAPMKLGVAIVDICTGLYATIAILGALNARANGAPGQHVEVSLHATGLSLLANVAANVLISGNSAGRYGNGHPNIVPYRAFRCADADIAVAVGNDGQFGLFAGALGHPEWAVDPRFARNRDRVDNRAELEAMIEAEMLARSADDWLARLMEAGVPASRINQVDEALADPQAAANAMVVDVEHATAGLFRALGVPMRFSETPASLRAAPPTLGEHTDAILRERLCKSDEEIARLRADKIV